MKFLNGIDLQSQRAQNAADPSSAQDLVTLNYLQNKLAGLEWKVEVRAATTANGTLSTAFANGQVVDGVTLATGDRILLKNQSTQTDNGIYTVNSAGAPTRATDANTSSSLNNATVLVTSGTANVDTAWTQTTANPTIGSSNIVFVQFGAGTSYSAGNGLQLASTTFSVLANGSSIDVGASGVRISSSALGNGLTGGSGTAVSVNAGTGLAFSGSTLTTDHSIIPQKFASTISTTGGTPLTVTHNLGTQDIVVMLWDAASSGNLIQADIQQTNSNALTVTTAASQTSMRIVVIG